MKDKEELLPCPFCGGEAELINHDLHFSDSVMRQRSIACLNCNTSSCWSGQNIKVIRAWNRRVNLLLER